MIFLGHTLVHRPQPIHRRVSTRAIPSFMHIAFAKFAMGDPNYVSPYALIIGIIAALIIFKHWANIKRLTSGTESKFSFKKSVKTASDTKNEEDK